jgi:hypothetical protein
VCGVCVCVCVCVRRRVREIGVQREAFSRVLVIAVRVLCLCVFPVVRALYPLHMTIRSCVIDVSRVCVRFCVCVVSRGYATFDRTKPHVNIGTIGTASREGCVHTHTHIHAHKHTHIHTAHTHTNIH